jgi:tyrosyl-tRNA synthetase
MFGKLMSISDELMARYYLLLLGEELPAIHPMEAKKQLAARIVERYHSADAARAALEDFNTRFSKRDLEHAELPTLSLAGVADDIVSIVVAGFEQGFSLKKSRSDARRLVEQGSVQVHGAKFTDLKAAPGLKAGDVVRLDKTRAVRVG